jgi:hypothetical protein
MQMSAFGGGYSSLNPPFQSFSLYHPPPSLNQTSIHQQQHHLMMPNIASDTTLNTNAFSRPVDYPLDHQFQQGGITSSTFSRHDGDNNSITEVGQKRSFVRMQAGTIWEDKTLADWPENDFRLYVRNLGGEVTDKILADPFLKWKSFAMAKVVRDKKGCKGYGFVSFLDPFDALAAMKELDNKYIGTRTVKIKRSHWTEKQIDVKKVKGDR